MFDDVQPVFIFTIFFHLTHVSILPPQKKGFEKGTRAVRPNAVIDNEALRKNLCEKLGMDTTKTKILSMRQVDHGEIICVFVLICKQQKAFCVCDRERYCSWGSCTY